MENSTNHSISLPCGPSARRIGPETAAPGITLDGESNAPVDAQAAKAAKRLFKLNYDTVFTPITTEARCAIAQQLAQTGNFRAAVREFLLAAKTAEPPVRVRVFAQLGIVFRRCGENGKAAVVLRAANEMDFLLNGEEARYSVQYRMVQRMRQYCLQPRKRDIITAEPVAEPVAEPRLQKVLQWSIGASGTDEKDFLVVLNFLGTLNTAVARPSVEKAVREMVERMVEPAEEYAAALCQHGELRQQALQFVGGSFAGLGMEGGFSDACGLEVPFYVRVARQRQQMLDDLLETSRTAFSDISDESEPSDVLGEFVTKISALSIKESVTLMVQMAPILIVRVMCDIVASPELRIGSLYTSDDSDVAVALRRLPTVSQCQKCIHHKLILGFYALYVGLTEKAAELLGWLVTAIDQLTAAALQLNRPLAVPTAVCAFVHSLWAESVCTGAVADSEKTRSRVQIGLRSLYTLTSTPGTDPAEFPACFRATGLVLLMKSRSEGSWTKIDGIPAVRLARGDLYEMIRKFILTASMKADDDLTVAAEYELILWGILLHGGFHMEVVVMFLRLWRYFQLRGSFAVGKAKEAVELPGLTAAIVACRADIDYYCAHIADKVAELSSDYLADGAGTVKELGVFVPQGLWQPEAGRIYLLDRLYREAVFDGASSVAPSRSQNGALIMAGDSSVPQTTLAEPSSAMLSDLHTFSRNIVQCWFSAYSHYHPVFPDSLAACLGNGRMLSRWLNDPLQDSTESSIDSSLDSSRYSL